MFSESSLRDLLKSGFVILFQLILRRKKEEEKKKKKKRRRKKTFFVSADDAQKYVFLHLYCFTSEIALSQETPVRL
jgi:hypothetical protein